LVKNPTLER